MARPRPNPHAPLPTSTIKIIYQNINGWQNKSQILRQAFSTVNADVILLAHTGLENNNPLKFHPYTPYQHTTGGYYSGVGILIKNNIQHSLVKHKFKHDTIAIRVETTTGPIILATNYHPPRYNHLPQEDLDWLANHNTPTYLLADLNAHHHAFPYNSGENSKGRVLSNLWLDWGRLIRLGPDFPTVHKTGSSGTTPDIILANKRTYHNHFITPLQSNSSDHLPVKMTISSKPIVKKVKCENTDAANWKGYTEHLKSTASNVNLRQCTQQELCDTIASKITSIQDARKQYIPQIKICTRPFIPISPKFKRLTAVLCKLRDYHSNTRDPATHVMLTKHRRKTIQLLREEGILLAKYHWQELVEKAAKLRTSDPRKYWIAIQKLKGKPIQRIAITKNSQKNGELITEAPEQVRHMTKFWSKQIGPPPPENMHPDTVAELDKLFNDDPDVCSPHPMADFNRLTPGCPYTKPITPIEVYNTINSFKHKAPGEDGINKKHLTYLPKIIIVQIAHIFSAALSLGYFPDNLKSAIMIFIPKPNKPKWDPGNYRPISLISTIAKIYGKILTYRFTTFLKEEEHQHPHQYGFTQNRGTISSLAMTYENIARQIAGPGRSRISLVLRDIKGAFDRLDHRRIKYHLVKIKLPPLLCKALSSFLDNRTAKIRIGSVIGIPFPLLGGVPQGASPSAPVFNLVIRLAPIGENIRFQNTWYADDSHQTIVTPASNKAEPSTQRHGNEIVRAIKKQNEFEHREGLITDPDKSWVIPINQVKYPEIIVNNKEYKQPKQPVKLLGLTVTKTSFTCSHITEQVTKAKKALGSIRRFYSLPREHKLGLVKTKVLTHLYSPPVPLHTASKAGMIKLQQVQNKALRWACNINWYDFVSNKKIHKKLKILPVNQELYWRARKIWDKIQNNNAADLATYTALTQMEFYSHKQKLRFPSSLKAISEAEPLPIYGS